MPAPSERLFLAIPLPAIVREALGGLQEARRGFRWTEPENLHLTLKFIGDCTAEGRETIVTALSAVNVRRFPVTIEGLGLFPRRGPPGVLWAGVAKPHPHLFALHQQIDDTLFGLGIEPDRIRYTPHVTLARVREASPGSVNEFVKQHRNAGAPPFFPDRYSLIRSILNHGSPLYEPIWEQTLVPA